MSETKAMQMDRLLTGPNGIFHHEAVADVIHTVYRIDLTQIPILPKVGATNRQLAQEPVNAADALRKAQEEALSQMDGPSVRLLINQICGVNLDAISALEGSGIALFSKGQWILRNENDLVEVHTSEGDREVMIYATERCTKKTGSSEFPSELGQALSMLGYQASSDNCGSYAFASPDGKAVPDAFKGATISAIMSFLKP